MNKPIYRAIPNASDNAYWEISINQHNRSITFVPKDKVLHRELKERAWKLIQTKSPRKNLNNNKY